LPVNNKHAVQQQQPSTSSGREWRALAAQILRFGASTGVSALLSFGLPILLHEVFAVEVRWAVAIAFAVAYVVNVALLRAFVFRSHLTLAQQLVRYVPANGCLRLIEYFVTLALTQRAGLDYKLSILLVLGISSVAKFFIYRMIFKSREASAG
jgi:putative flippase GtrA